MTRPRHLPSQPSRWVLLDGSRLVVAAGLCGTVFSLTLAGGLTGVLELDAVGPVRSFLGSLVGGTLPFITVVLAINQLILTQEFGTTGDFRERLQETDEYRREVEADLNVDRVPADPAAFLDRLVEGVGRRSSASGVGTRTWTEGSSTPWTGTSPT